MHGAAGKIHGSGYLVARHHRYLFLAQVAIHVVGLFAQGNKGAAALSGAQGETVKAALAVANHERRVEVQGIVCISHTRRLAFF